MHYSMCVPICAADHLRDAEHPSVDIAVECERRDDREGPLEDLAIAAALLLQPHQPREPGEERGAPEELPAGAARGDGRGGRALHARGAARHGDEETALAVASHVYSSIGVHPPPSSGSSGAVRERELRMRCTALLLLSAVLSSHASLSVAPSTAQLLRGLVGLLAQRDTRLLELTWEAIGALVKRMDTTLMQEHISSLRQVLRFALLEHKSLEPLPGFTLPNKV